MLLMYCTDFYESSKGIFRISSKNKYYHIQKLYRTTKTNKYIQNGTSYECYDASETYGLDYFDLQAVKSLKPNHVAEQFSV